MSLALLGGVGVLAYHTWRTPRARAGEQRAAATTRLASPDVRVEVTHPREGSHARTTSQPGTVRSFEHASLYAKVSGYLKTLAVDIGDRVEEGQTIAEIDSPERVKAVEQAQAALEKARAGARQAATRTATARASVGVAEALIAEAHAQLEEATARRTNRKSEYDRIADLARRRAIEKKLVDEEEERYATALAAEHAATAGIESARAQVEEAKAKVDQAIAEAEMAEAQIAVAQADLDEANVMLAYTKIVSPYAGIVTARNFHRGDFIRSAADSGGPPVLAVARNDLMRVIVQVPDRDVPFVDRGDPATVIFDALGGATFEGKVARFSASEDEQTRTMRTEIDLPNQDGRLRDGMYGRVVIQLEGAGQLLTVPSSALVERSGPNGAVYVVRDGQAHKVPVQVGRDNGVEAEILSGLTPDEVVVVRAIGSLGEDTPVREEPYRPNGATREGRAG
jgi:RND family efflux transporter MFP subunit